MSDEARTYLSRLIALSSMAFLLIGSYAVARPCIDSLFLSHYSPEQLPYAWLLMAACTAGAIAIYNHYNVRYSLLRLFGASAILSCISLAFLLIGVGKEWPFFVFALYVWKEVYMVVLIEIFWSFSDVVFSIRKARNTYGALLAFGSIGGLLGNFLVGYFAKAFGTLNTLWSLLPLLLVCLAISAVISKVAGDRVPQSIMKQKHHFSDSFKVVWKSRYLMPLLLLVSVLQMAVTFIDYDYSTAMQRAFSDVDMRTNAIGNVHAVIDVIALILQASTALILRFVGVAGTLLFVPCVVGASVLVAVIFPHLLLAVIATKISVKSFDYSIFRAAKEILYIPLSRLEKTQGKGMIDILAYRVSKGFSSVMLLLLVSCGLSAYFMPLTLIFVALWLLLTFVIAKRYREMVSFDEEVNLHEQK